MILLWRRLLSCLGRRRMPKQTPYPYSWIWLMRNTWYLCKNSPHGSQNQPMLGSEEEWFYGGLQGKA